MHMLLSINGVYSWFCHITPNKKDGADEDQATRSFLDLEVWPIAHVEEISPVIMATNHNHHTIPRDDSSWNIRGLSPNKVGQRRAQKQDGRQHTFF